MNQLLLVTPVLLPIAGGILMLMIPEKEARVHPIFTELIVLAASAMIWAVLFTGRGQGNGAVLFSMAGNLKVFFRMDGMGAVFSGLVSVLWYCKSSQGRNRQEK